MKNLKPFLVILLTVLFLLKPDFLAAESAHGSSPELPPRAEFILIQDANYSAGLTPQTAEQVAGTYMASLEATADEVEQVFNYSHQGQIFLRLMPKYKYVRDIKAPSWSGALFTGNTIIVPVDSKTVKELQNTTKLQKVLRHEYVHALVYELSGGKCPVWLDEGLAQMMEGNLNALLVPALGKYLKNNQPIPVSKLESGFIKLDRQQAPVVYAQSLYATKFLISRYGMSKIVAFLKKLKSGMSQEAAFKLTFGITIQEFDNALSESLDEWVVQGARTI